MPTQTQPPVKLALLWLILVLVLAAGAGAVPVQVQAQAESLPVGSAVQPGHSAGDLQDIQAPEAPAAASFPDPPVYDSGWLAIDTYSYLLLTHNLGSQGFTNPDAYVVDLRFRDTTTGIESLGVNQAAYGGNELIAPVPAGYTPNDRVGGYWFGLNTEMIRVYWSFMIYNPITSFTSATTAASPRMSPIQTTAPTGTA